MERRNQCRNQHGNLLVMMLMYKHLLFGLNIGFQHLGLGPYCNAVNFSDEELMHSNLLILLSRSSMIMLLMVRLLQKQHRIKDRIKSIFSKVFSLKPRQFSFAPFAKIIGDQGFSICKIKVLPITAPHLVGLQLQTLCKPPKPRGMDDWKYYQQMPKDDKRYSFDLRTVETTCEAGPPSTQNSFSVSATQGEYRAHGVENGALKVSFRKNSVLVNSHSFSIEAIEFHPELPILATYNGVDKEVKLWFIPPELSSNPVLVSILKIPVSCVFSIAFHPKLPIIFIGKLDGNIEVWWAI